MNKYLQYFYCLLGDHYAPWGTWVKVADVLLEPRRCEYCDYYELLWYDSECRHFLTEIFQGGKRIKWWNKEAYKEANDAGISLWEFVKERGSNGYDNFRLSKFKNS